LFHELGDSLCVTASGERELAEFVLQFRLACKTVLLCERTLDIAQAGFSRSR
jgi:hypothetical protein